MSSTDAPSQNNEQWAVMEDQFSGLITSLATMKQSISALQAQVRALEKSTKKQVKALQKEALKNKNKGNRKPSGFAKPARVSPKLCEFMNKESGSEIARTEVTKYLISYINENNLQKPENRKIIIPDSNLKELLQPEENEQVTYFNLQRLMNKHFIKDTDNTKASTTNV